MPWTWGLKPKFKRCIVGFYKSHGMELYDNVSRMNYRVLGFEDVNGKQGGTFNVHGEVCYPA